MKFKSIRISLTLWFFFVALIPLSVVIFVIYIDMVESIKNEAFSNLIGIRDLKVMQLKHWIEERRSDISVLASKPELKRFDDFTGMEESDRQVFLEYKNILRESINSRRINYRGYSELFFISAYTGKVVVASSEEFEGEDQSENTAFITPMRTRNVFISDIHYSKEIDTVSLAFSSPVFSADNEDEITGVVVAMIDLHQSLYTLLLDRSGMGNTGETLIVNKDVVALNELRWQKNAPLNLKINTKPAVLASRGKSGIVETEDYRGKKVLAAYTYIPDTSWGFVAKQYLDEIYEPVKRLLHTCLIIYFVSIVAVYLIAMFVARGIAEPIRSFVSTAEKLKKGDLSVRSTIERADEVGILSSALNDMTAALDSRIKAQANTSEIINIVIKEEKPEKFGNNVLQKIMDLTSSELGSFYVLDANTSRFVPVASCGIQKDLLEPIDYTKLEGKLVRETELGRTNHIKDITVETFRGFKVLAGETLPKEIITISLVTKGKTNGMFFLGTTNCYTPDQLEIIDNLLSSLSTGLSSLLTNDMTKKMAANLKEANCDLKLSKNELQQKSDVLEEQNVELASQKRQVEERTQDLKLRVYESEQLNKAMVNLLEDLQEYQTQLESTSKKLAYSNKELEGFSYSVSHDLRAPLRHMSGFVDLLQKQAGDSFDDKSNRYIVIIKESATKMGQLIDDLLHYSRTGRAEMAKTMVNNDGLVQEVVSELESHEKDLQIEWIVEPLPQIPADHALLRVVWTNLLTNAIKFSAKKEKVRIEIGSRPGENDEIVFYVKDNGAGFDMKYKDKLFGVFQRLHRDSEFKGTGIGLATVQRILYRHGGRVWAEGVVGEGATLFFALPKEI